MDIKLVEFVVVVRMVTVNSQIMMLSGCCAHCGVWVHGSCLQENESDAVDLPDYILDKWTQLTHLTQPVFS